MVKAMRDRATGWTQLQKWGAVFMSGALLCFAGFVGVGATKGYQAAQDVCRIEKKVDEQAVRDSQNMKSYGRIEAFLESMQKQLDDIASKLDRHMEQKHIDRGH